MSRLIEIQVFSCDWLREGCWIEELLKETTNGSRAWKRHMKKGAVVVADPAAEIAGYALLTYPTLAPKAL